MKHKWHKEICAWANGAEIEVRCPLDNGWTSWSNVTATHPSWFDENEYRIKPQPKEPQYVYAWLVKDTEECVWYFDKPEGILNDDWHQYIGKIKLEQDE